MVLEARSKERFPSLGPKGCPWHEDCTPMDCEFYRLAPRGLHGEELMEQLQRARANYKAMEERREKRVVRERTKLPPVPRKKNK